MHDVEQLHDGGSVIGNGGAFVVVHELVHAPRAERGAHHIDDGNAGVDVADELRFALGDIGALFQQNNLRLLPEIQTDE